jgi:hypothetical protein
MGGVSCAKKDEFKPADVSRLVYLVAVGVSVARQVALELHPVHSLDASLFVSVNKEMLLGMGDVVKDETVQRRNEQHAEARRLVDLLPLPLVEKPSE